MEQDLQDEFFDPEKIEVFIFLEDPEAYSNASVLISVIRDCFRQMPGVERAKQIEKLMTKFNWVPYYTDKNTGRRVLTQARRIDHPHELTTAVRLAKKNYDVIFAPGGMFNRDSKKFDILLVRDSTIHKADLKCITSKFPYTIAKRIIGGSEQASRVVVDINSDLKRKDLIDGLRGGVERNSLIEEIILLYKGKCYRLRKNQILGREINEIIK